VKSGVKEGTMKKFIYITVAIMLMAIFIGCATTPEQRKDKYDIRKDVGNSQFVGSSKNLDAKGLMPTLAY
jgi:hypothetical protein